MSAAQQSATAMMNPMLRMQLYVITTVAKAPREQIEAMLPEHLEIGRAHV